MLKQALLMAVLVIIVASITPVYAQSQGIPQSVDALESAFEGFEEFTILLEGRVTTNENDVTNLATADITINQELNTLDLSLTTLDSFVTLIENRTTTIENSISTLFSDNVILNTIVNGIQSAFAVLDNRITTTETDIVIIKSDIVELQNPIGSAAPTTYTKSTLRTVGESNIIEFEAFCDPGDLIINGYLQDIEEPRQRHTIIQSNSIHQTGGDEGWIVRTITASTPERIFEGVIICLDTNP